MKSYTAYKGGSNTIPLSDLEVGIEMTVNLPSWGGQQPSTTVVLVNQADVLAWIAQCRGDGTPENPPYTATRVQYLCATDPVFAARAAAAWMSNQMTFAAPPGQGIGMGGNGVGGVQTPREYYVYPWPHSKSGV